MHTGVMGFSAGHIPHNSSSTSGVHNKWLHALPGIDATVAAFVKLYRGLSYVDFYAHCSCNVAGYNTVLYMLLLGERRRCHCTLYVF